MEKEPLHHTTPDQRSKKKRVRKNTYKGEILFSFFLFFSLHFYLSFFSILCHSLLLGYRWQFSFRLQKQTRTKYVSIRRKNHTDYTMYKMCTQYMGARQCKCNFCSGLQLHLGCVLRVCKGHSYNFIFVQTDSFFSATTKVKLLSNGYRQNFVI